MTATATVAAGGLVAPGPAAAAPGDPPSLGNPSFELYRPGTLASCWRQRVTGRSAGSVGGVPGAHTGLRAVKLTATSVSTGARQIVVDQATAGCAPKALPGKQYDLSVWFKANARVQLAVYYRDAYGRWRWWVNSPWASPRSTWGLLRFRTPAVPAGATAISFGPSLRSAGWAIVDDAAFSAVAGKVVRVATAAQLQTALTAARPGTTVQLADGVYRGRFVARTAGTATAPIRLIGSRAAVLDGGSVSSGYVLHLDRAHYWRVEGITIRNGQKAIVLDETQHARLDNLHISRTGNEAVLFRNFSRDNLIANSVIHDAGNTTAAYGEGVYVGLAKSNWSSSQSRTGGAADTSDRNRILGNLIYDTTAENIDIKEGTRGGLIADNRFNSVGMTGANYADSWVDIAGNGWAVRRNTGTNPGGPLRDGFQTHVLLAGWGRNNIFQGNTAAVNAPGYGIWIHTATAGNVVKADNRATGAAKGLTNIGVTP